MSVTESIKQMYGEYHRIEFDIYKLLKKQPRFGQVCDCEEPEWIGIRDVGQEDENDIIIKAYCAVCGGEEQ